MKKRTVSDGKAIVARYQRSGLSQERFAKRIGISVAVVRYWIRRMREMHQEEGPGFRFVEVTPTVTPIRESSRVELPGGIVLKTSELPSPQYLAELSTQLQYRSVC